jgi:hypothetical protein
MNRFEKSLDRIKKWVEPQDSWTEDDWEHYKTVIEALQIAADTVKGGDK